MKQLELKIDEPQVGDVRVVRADKYNFVTERYNAIESKDKETKETTVRYDWQQVGFYGENLAMACRKALDEGTHGSDVAELLRTLQRAEKVVLASVAALADPQYGEKK